jgi:hypothetical protein
MSLDRDSGIASIPSGTHEPVELVAGGRIDEDEIVRAVVVDGFGRGRPVV